MSQTVIGPSPAAGGSSIINPAVPSGSSVASAQVIRGTMIVTGCAAGQLLLCKSGEAEQGILFELCPTGLNTAGQPLGIALETVEGGEQVNCQFAGVVTLTTEQWDAISDTSGGLVRGQRYYHSRTLAGGLTDIAPTSGQVIASAGVGLDATRLFVVIGPPTTQA